MLVFFSFLGTSLGINYAHAALTLPEPTQLLGLSPTYSFPILKGLKLNPANPLQIEFIIDSANQGTVSKEEASKLIRYFLAGLTIPEDDLWVNLSVYEKDRMINESAAQTDVGRDMLAQDYVLKQLVSSLTYPESETGKSYWQKAYQAAAKAFGTTDIKLDTFNKIWIAPDKAEVYEYKNTAVVNQATLKALLEQDFVALQQNQTPGQAIDQKTKKPKNQKTFTTEGSAERSGASLKGTEKNKNVINARTEQINRVASDVMREVVVPKITDDINYGKNFATLRQIYYSLILAKWFKGKFKESFYKHYINQKKIKGIDINDPTAKEQIYNLYTQAFKKGIYDYIKKESDPGTHKQVRRRYFSGGIQGLAASPTVERVDASAFAASPVRGRLYDAGTEIFAERRVEKTGGRGMWDVGRGTRNTGGESASPADTNVRRAWARITKLLYEGNVEYKVTYPIDGRVNIMIAAASDKFDIQKLPDIVRSVQTACRNRVNVALHGYNPSFRMLGNRAFKLPGSRDLRIIITPKPAANSAGMETEGRRAPAASPLGRETKAGSPAAGDWSLTNDVLVYRGKSISLVYLHEIRKALPRYLELVGNNVPGTVSKDTLKGRAIFGFQGVLQTALGKQFEEFCGKPFFSSSPANPQPPTAIKLGEIREALKHLMGPKKQPSSPGSFPSMAIFVASLTSGINRLTKGKYTAAQTQEALERFAKSLPCSIVRTKEGTVRLHKKPRQPLFTKKEGHTMTNVIATLQSKGFRINEDALRPPLNRLNSLHSRRKAGHETLHLLMRNFNDKSGHREILVEVTLYQSGTGRILSISYTNPFNQKENDIPVEDVFPQVPAAVSSPVIDADELKSQIYQLLDPYLNQAMGWMARMEQSVPDPDKEKLEGEMNSETSKLIEKLEAFFLENNRGATAIPKEIITMEEQVIETLQSDLVFLQSALKNDIFDRNSALYATTDMPASSQQLKDAVCSYGTENFATDIYASNIIKAYLDGLQFEEALKYMGMLHFGDKRYCAIILLHASAYAQGFLGKPIPGPGEEGFLTYFMGYINRTKAVDLLVRGGGIPREAAESFLDRNIRLLSAALRPKAVASPVRQRTGFPTTGSIPAELKRVMTDLIKIHRSYEGRPLTLIESATCMHNEDVIYNMANALHVILSGQDITPDIRKRLGRLEKLLKEYDSYHGKNLDVGGHMSRGETVQAMIREADWLLIKVRTTSEPGQAGSPLPTDAKVAPALANAIRSATVILHGESFGTRGGTVIGKSDEKVFIIAPAILTLRNNDTVLVNTPALTSARTENVLATVEDISRDKGLMLLSLPTRDTLCPVPLNAHFNENFPKSQIHNVAAGFFSEGKTIEAFPLLARTDLEYLENSVPKLEIWQQAGMIGVPLLGQDGSCIGMVTEVEGSHGALPRFITATADEILEYLRNIKDRFPGLPLYAASPDRDARADEVPPAGMSDSPAAKPAASSAARVGDDPEVITAADRFTDTFLEEGYVGRNGDGKSKKEIKEEISRIIRNILNKKDLTKKQKTVRIDNGRAIEISTARIENAQLNIHYIFWEGRNHHRINSISPIENKREWLKRRRGQREAANISSSPDFLALAGMEVGSARDYVTTSLIGALRSGKKENIERLAKQVSRYIAANNRDVRTFGIRTFVLGLLHKTIRLYLEPYGRNQPEQRELWRELAWGFINHLAPAIISIKETPEDILIEYKTNPDSPSAKNTVGLWSRTMVQDDLIKATIETCVGRARAPYVSSPADSFPNAVSSETPASTPSQTLEETLSEIDGLSGQIEGIPYDDNRYLLPEAEIGRRQGLRQKLVVLIVEKDIATLQAIAARIEEKHKKYYPLITRRIVEIIAGIDGGYIALLGKPDAPEAEKSAAVLKLSRITGTGVNREILRRAIAALRAYKEKLSGRPEEPRSDPSLAGNKLKNIGAAIGNLGTLLRAAGSPIEETAAEQGAAATTLSSEAETLFRQINGLIDEIRDTFRNTFNNHRFKYRTLPEILGQQKQTRHQNAREALEALVAEQEDVSVLREVVSEMQRLMPEKPRRTSSLKVETAALYSSYLLILIRRIRERELELKTREPAENGEGQKAIAFDSSTTDAAGPTTAGSPDVDSSLIPNPSSLVSSPGGIKMSNIPVISSSNSQMIAFAAIGPDFFDRLTFRIVSMKHIASLAQFASLP